ncbi:MAG TPA: hypothetical protein VE263_19365 [Candidatus Angelobacter sp.]|nr:hypothetical protein [Candidatus Angelobacter sp.]
MALVPALLLGYFFVVSQAQLAWKNYWLVKDGQQGTAVVTRVLWTGHRGVAYQYRANQVEYTGADAVSRDHPRAVPFSRGDLYPAAVAGENLAVYFSASHPWLSRLNRPRSMIIEGLPVLLLVWALEALLILTMIAPNSKWALRFGEDAK